MPMIRHQAMRHHTDTRHLLDGLVHDAFKRFVVTILVKDTQPAIGPIQDMVDVATQRCSQRPSHTLQTYPTPLVLSRKRLLTPFPFPDTFSFPQAWPLFFSRSEDFASRLPSVGRQRVAFCVVPRPGFGKDGVGNRKANVPDRGVGIGSWN